ncbi:MAG: hypothetical protein HWE27_17795 [Gammaproteobacteria bacterium]|nr:hypothetical protein [Gammaproteobacteria bacterium]
MTILVDKQSIANLFACKAASSDVTQLQCDDLLNQMLDWVCPEFKESVKSQSIKFSDVSSTVTQVCMLGNKVIGCFNDAAIEQLFFAGDNKEKSDKRKVTKAFFAELTGYQADEIEIVKLSDIELNLNFALSALMLGSDQIIAVVPFTMPLSGTKGEALKLDKLPLGDSLAEVNFSVESRVSATDIFDIKPGMTIELKHDITRPFNALMDQEVIGYAYLCQKDKKVQATFVKEK